ncbi:MAG: DNA-formamidopyrimidine glycosylase family protein [Dehalococcoidia bacterium]
MPEIPDLEVIKDFLNERLPGKEIVRAEAPRPWIVRSLAADDFVEDVRGRAFGHMQRQGKDLLLPLGEDRLLVMNLMLTGRLQYCAPDKKPSKRLFFLLGTEEADLRYLDDKQMGLIYYVRLDQLGQITRLHEQGPDALEGGLTFDAFQERLRPYTGEIKGVIARGKFLSGIGNAYVDEILWAARVSPFRKSRTLTEDERRAIYDSIPQVLREATEEVRKRMPPDIHVKVRDFLKVHRKGGEPCPRCGAAISEITPNQRITSWCRQCQPGALIKN